MTTFIAFALACGVVIDHLDDSDRIRRCPTVAKPKSRNGAYQWNGRTGWVRCWDGDGETHVFIDPNAKPPTKEEQAALNAKREARIAEIARGHQMAAQKAEFMLSKAEQKTHAYLARKGFPEALGMVSERGDLLVPMRSHGGNVVGLQRIFWLPDELKFDKSMLKGTKLEGAYLVLGPTNAPEFVLVEGYATGLSVQAALKSSGIRASVVICFTAHNITVVAPMIRGRVIVFADNDPEFAGQKAAKATGLPWCMSPTLGQDANDWHLKSGPFPLTMAINKARQQHARRAA